MIPKGEVGVLFSFMKFEGNRIFHKNLHHTQRCEITLIIVLICVGCHNKKRHTGDLLI